MAGAAELADHFALEAADQDRTGAFRYTDFDAIRGTLLPRMVVPVELCGLGANLLAGAGEAILLLVKQALPV